MWKSFHLKERNNMPYYVTPDPVDDTKWNVRTPAGKYVKTYSNKGVAMMQAARLNRGHGMYRGKVGAFTPPAGSRNDAFRQRNNKMGVSSIYSRPAKKPGPGSKYGRYAVLICFDGPEAKSKAWEAHRLLASSIRSDNNQVPLMMRSLRQACCLALHDCVQHPLNPKG